MDDFADPLEGLRWLAKGNGQNLTVLRQGIEGYEAERALADDLAAVLGRLQLALWGTDTDLGPGMPADVDRQLARYREARR